MQELEAYAVRPLTGDAIVGGLALCDPCLDSKGVNQAENLLCQCDVGLIECDLPLLRHIAIRVDKPLKEFDPLFHGATQVCLWDVLVAKKPCLAKFLVQPKNIELLELRVERCRVTTRLNLRPHHVHVLVRTPNGSARRTAVPKPHAKNVWVNRQVGMWVANRRHKR